MLHACHSATGAPIAAVLVSFEDFPTTQEISKQTPPWVSQRVKTVTYMPCLFSVIHSNALSLRGHHLVPLRIALACIFFSWVLCTS